MTETLFAWAVIILGWLLPLALIILLPGAGSWRPPEGSRCPLGTRVGWLVIVLLLGPIGVLLFARRRR